MTKLSITLFAIFCTGTLFASCLGYGEICVTNGLVIPLDEEKQHPTMCVLYKCKKDAGRIVLNTVTCAPQEPRRGCRHVEAPFELPFPDCCPLTVCKAPVYGEVL